MTDGRERCLTCDASTDAPAHCRMCRREDYIDGYTPEEPWWEPEDIESMPVTWDWDGKELR